MSADLVDEPQLLLDASDIYGPLRMTISVADGMESRNYPKPKKQVWSCRASLSLVVPIIDSYVPGLRDSDRSIRCPQVPQE